MRALLKQTISRLQADYVVLHGGEAIYNIRVPFSVYPLNIEICDSPWLTCFNHKGNISTFIFHSANLKEDTEFFSLFSVSKTER